MAPLNVTSYGKSLHAHLKLSSVLISSPNPKARLEETLSHVMNGGRQVISQEWFLSMPFFVIQLDHEEQCPAETC